jgi:hypothetical protein
MAIDFLSALRDIFEAAEHAAVYTPVAGGPKTIYVLPKQPDAIIGIEGTKIQSKTAIFEVLADDIAQPVKGDRMTYNNAAYIVQGAACEDDERLIWTVNTYPA